MSSVRPNKWAMLSVTYLALIAAFIPYVGWTPALTPISEDLSLSYAQAGALSSATALVAGIAMFFAGAACTKWGPRNVILLGLLAAVAGQFMFAAADTYSMTMSSRLVSGLAVGLLFVGTYTLAVNWFQGDNQAGRAVAIAMTGDGVGILANLFFFALVLTAFGWRTGLVIEGVVLVAVLVVSVFFMRNAPAVEVEPVVDLSAPERSSRQTLMNRSVLAAVLFWIGGVGLFSLIASWMATILIETAGWSEGVAGFLASLLSLVGIIGALAAEFSASRMGSRRRMGFICGLLMTVAVAGIGYALVSGAYGLVVVFIPVLGLALYAGEMLVLAVAIDSVKPSLAGTVNGVVLGASWVIGAVLYPYVLGYLRDTTGSYSTGFVVLGVATLLLCGLSPLLSRKSDADVPVAGAPQRERSDGAVV